METYIDRCHKALNYILADKDYFKAVLTLTPRNKWGTIKEEEARTHYAVMFYTHLARGEYEEAAAMVLPKHRFNLDSRSARRVWNLCREEKRLLIMGAGAVGKTFTIGVWTLLDWLRDPENTLVNVISVTKKHARGNLFGDLCNTWKIINNTVPLVGEVSGEKIATSSSSDTSGIFLVGIAEGDQGVGRLRGLHPKPRMVPHPVFGNLTRTRTLLDEAGEIPRGIWSDLRNAFITQEGDDPERIKILGASNPEDPNSEYGQRCEPIGGWVNHDDELEEWNSERGWKVFRIDAAKTENILERKMVIEGMQTYEGYLAAMADSGGEGSPGYWCADTQTELLSMRGWLKYDEVLVGDIIWTLNPAGHAEWRPVLEVFKKHYDGEMISFESKQFSALVTPNHSWPVSNKNRRKQKKDPMKVVLKETWKLAKHDQIPLARDPIFHESKHSPDFAELMGWWITDGSNLPSNRIAIYQSHEANQTKCDRIRTLLKNLGATFSENRHGSMTHFRFANGLGKMMKLASPNKRLEMPFIESLSKDGRVALFNGLVGGDGSYIGSMPMFCSKTKSDTDAFQGLCALLGMSSRSTQIYVKPNLIRTSNTMSPGCLMNYAYARWETKYTRPGNNRMHPVPYSGIVWCPRTENGTFFARRNGHTYFTGNTMCRGTFPPSGHGAAIISNNLLQRAKGEWIFEDVPTDIYSLDSALEGGDLPILSYGKFGMAKKAIIEGEVIEIHKVARQVIQVDFQIPLGKGDSVKVAENCRDELPKGVDASWVAIDGTGSGDGVLSALRRFIGPEIMAVIYSQSPTEAKIMTDDDRPAHKVYRNLRAELWYSMRRWLESRLILFSNQCEVDLYRELSGIRGGLIGGKYVVEKKDKYKARNRGRSPDHAESCIQLVHLVRVRGDIEAGLFEDTNDVSNFWEDRSKLLDPMSAGGSSYDTSKN